jgi:integrase
VAAKIPAETICGKCGSSSGTVAIGGWNADKNVTDVQHLLAHASVKTTEKAYAAFVKNELFKQTIELLDRPAQPKLKVVR